jgi:hypothetical protein
VPGDEETVAALLTENVFGLDIHVSSSKGHNWAATTRSVVDRQIRRG